MKTEENDFFAGFGAEAQKKLLAAMQHETYPDGAFLFKEHDRADCVYIVLSGEVCLEKTLDGDHTVTLARIGAGDYFGDMGVIDSCNRSTSARAVGRTELGRIGAEVLMEALCADSAEVSLGFFRRLSERLRHANQRFVEQVLHKEKLTLVGEMARSIFHDFRNAMAGIMGMAELIRMGSEGDEKLLHYTDILSEEVEHLNAMVQDLFEFARGESPINQKAMSVKDLFDRIERLNAEPLKLADVAFSVSPKDAMLEVDPTRFLRVLQNLISNAVQAFGPGGGTVRLEAEAGDPDFVEIIVRDDGPGIPEHIRKTIFQPFVTAGKESGAGLGMSIVKKIVDAHGGTIAFDTEVGMGTTFRIRMPRGRE
jgi:signal transduction histidine kinase